MPEYETATSRSLRHGLGERAERRSRWRSNGPKCGRAVPERLRKSPHRSAARVVPRVECYQQHVGEAAMVTPDANG
jgi:hypothetical protein